MRILILLMIQLFFAVGLAKAEEIQITRIRTFGNPQFRCDGRFGPFLITPDESHILTCKTGVVRIWDVATGRDTGLFNLEQEKSELAGFTTNGAFLISLGSGACRLWSWPSHQLKHDVEIVPEVTCAAVSDDNSILALGYDETFHKLEIIDLESKKQIGCWTGIPFGTREIVFLPGGTNVPHCIRMV